MGSGVGARRGGSAGATAIAPGGTRFRGGITPAERNGGATLTPDNTGAVPQPVRTRPESQTTTPEPQPEAVTQNQAQGGYKNLLDLQNPRSESAPGYQAAFGSGQAPRVNFEPDVQGRINRVFGKNLSPQDIASLVGAPNGARVDVSTAGTHSIRVDIYHPLIESQHRTIIPHYDGSVEIHNDLFKVKPDAPKGFGAAVFAQQVANARRLGVREITVDAAGMPTTAKEIAYRKENGYSLPMNGYYTWARFGYQAPIPSWVQRDMPANLRTDNLNDLMQKPGGAAWWKENGEGFTGTFDLSSKSTSSRVLNYYLQDRGLKIR